MTIHEQGKQFQPFFSRPVSCVGEQTFLQIYLFILQCSKKFTTALRAIEQESKQPAVIGAWLFLIIGAFNFERQSLRTFNQLTVSSSWAERQDLPPGGLKTHSQFYNPPSVSCLATIYIPQNNSTRFETILENLENIDSSNGALESKQVRQWTKSQITGISSSPLNLLGCTMCDGQITQEGQWDICDVWSRSQLIELFTANDQLRGPREVLVASPFEPNSFKQLDGTEMYLFQLKANRLDAYKRQKNVLVKPLIMETSQIYRNYRSTYNQPTRVNEWFFSEHREAAHTQSYLMFFQWLVGLAIFRIFQALYRDHGKEILIFLVDALVLIGIINDEEWLKIELGLSHHRYFREARDVKKRLKDLAGVSSWAVEAGEIVWFLRAGNQSHRRFFSFVHSTRSLKTFLLFGPPGTGKTFLVQSLAGEAEVPILIQAGGVLKNPRQRGYGARAIQSLFRRARKIAPCIVFIDEIDGVGARRENFSAQANEQTEPIDVVDAWSAETVLKNFSDWHLAAPPLPSQQTDTEQDLDAFQIGEFLPDRSFYDPTALKVLQESQWEHLARAEQLSILTQLLIELDGLKPLNNLVVVGATNRPDALDPALLRPGRFNRSIETRLPNFQKRIELFCLYARPLTFNHPVPWAYLARRTEGASAADIAAIVNEVALKVARENCTLTTDIFDESVDTIFSHPVSASRLCSNNPRGFQTCSLNKKIVINQKIVKSASKIFNFQNFPFQPSAETLRLGYYLVGKNFVASKITGTVPQALIRVFERPKNFRMRERIFPISIKSIQARLRRCDLEMDLISLFAGHAAQVLGFGVPISIDRFLIRPCERYSLWALDQSNSGWFDAQCGRQLIQQMILQWYFYAHRVATEKLHSALMTSNPIELGKEQTRLLAAIGENLTQEIYTVNPPRAQGQRWSFRTWWQKIISNQLSLSDRSILEWYRIYLGDPEETERNIEWVPPDDYYHQSTFDQLENITRWNSLLRMGCEYLYRGLIFGALNASWIQLRLNCECVDILADALIRFEYMRDIQFQTILRNFRIRPLKKNLKKTSVTQPIMPSWGNQSRRSRGRTINFEALSSSNNELIDMHQQSSEEEEED